MRKPGGGFTLVELLIVIGIIALLVGMLFPVVNMARRQATLVVCASNLRQISAAALMHANEHQGFLPLAGELVLAVPPGYGENAIPASLSDVERRRYTYAGSPNYEAAMIVPITAALAPYMGYPDLDWNDWDKLDEKLNENEFWRRFICPATDSINKARKNQKKSSSKTLVGQGMIVTIRLEAGWLPATFSWSSNTDYAFNEGLLGFHHARKYLSRRMRGNIAKQRSTDRLVLFSDAQNRKSPSISGRDPWIAWTPSLESTGPVSLADALLNNGKALDKEMFDLNRHGGRMNIAFLDGHVEAVLIEPEKLHHAYLLPH